MYSRSLRRPAMMLACLLFVVWSVRADVVVRPETQHFQSPGSGVVKCSFPAPLSECFMRVTNHNDNRFDFLTDMRSGALSQSVTMHEHFNLSYAGNGLDPDGECGVRVDVASVPSVMLVECFGRTLGGQWGRGFGKITTDYYKVLPVNSLSPGLVIAAPGTNVAVLLKADRRLTDCYVVTPLEGYLNLAPSSTPPTGSRYRPHGAGLANKECGVVLNNVQEEDAGVWSTVAFDESTSPGFVARQATVVLIQVAPAGEPVLQINDPNNTKPGQMLQATCVAPPAVPPCQLTWLLGGHVVRHDELNATLPGDVGKSWPWQRQPRHQTFTHRLTTEDNGKRLECRMSHVALAGSRTVGHELIVSAGRTSGGNVTTTQKIAD